MPDAVDPAGLWGSLCPQVPRSEGMSATSCAQSPSLASQDPAEPALYMEGGLSPVQPGGFHQPGDSGVIVVVLEASLTEVACLQHLFVLYCFRPSGLTCSSASRMRKAPTW